jgi:hypothetical protein
MISTWLISGHGNGNLDQLVKVVLASFATAKLLFLPIHSVFVKSESLNPGHTQEGEDSALWWTECLYPLGLYVDT